MCIILIEFGQLGWITGWRVMHSPKKFLSVKGWLVPNLWWCPYSWHYLFSYWYDMLHIWLMLWRFHGGQNFESSNCSCVQAVLSIRMQHQHLMKMEHQLQEKQKQAERDRAIGHLHRTHSLERQKEDKSLMTEEKPLSGLGSPRKLYLAHLSAQPFTDSNEGKLCGQLRDRVSALESELLETQRQLSREKQDNTVLRKENKRFREELEQLRQDFNHRDMACNTLVGEANHPEVRLASHSSETNVANGLFSPIQPLQQDSSEDSSILTSLPPLGLPRVVQFQ